MSFYEAGMGRAALVTVAVTVLMLTVGVASTVLAASGKAILEAKCSGCHSLTGPAPTTLKGMWERKGPDLFYAGNKYKSEWLESWLQKPKRIRPAGMFYANHLKSGEERDLVDTATLKPHTALSAKEAKAVSTVLATFKAKSELIRTGEYKPGKISMSMGEMLFDKFRGCLACHQIEPDYGGFSAPEVYTAGERLQEDYLLSYMRNPKAWDPKAVMPSDYIRERDLQKFVHYLRGLAKEGGE
ncbi:MAG: cytochrome C [Thermodesulfobacteriota bacterium]